MAVSCFFFPLYISFLFTLAIGPASSSRLARSHSDTLAENQSDERFSRITLNKNSDLRATQLPCQGYLDIVFFQSEGYARLPTGSTLCWPSYCKLVCTVRLYFSLSRWNKSVWVKAGGMLTFCSRMLGREFPLSILSLRASPFCGGTHTRTEWETDLQILVDNKIHSHAKPEVSSVLQTAALLWWDADFASFKWRAKMHQVSRGS